MKIKKVLNVILVIKSISILVKLLKIYGKDG